MRNSLFKIYKIDPLKLDSLYWTASVVKDSVIICAEDERSALEIAHYTFWKASGRFPNGEIITSPWREKNLLKITDVTSSYKNIPTQKWILSHEEYNYEWPMCA